MSKLKIDKYTPNKEELKKIKEQAQKKDLAKKKKRRIMLFLNLLDKFVKLSAVLIVFSGTIYLLYIKNIFNIQNFITKAQDSYFKYKSQPISTNKESGNQNSNSSISSLLTETGENMTNEYVKIFKDRLASQDLVYASSSNLDEFGDIKIYLESTKDKAGYIILNTKNDTPDHIWVNFISALSSETLKQKLKIDLKNLLYIDLRFGNKVFYKFFEDNKNNSTSTITTTTITPIR